jgi:hypothetical protein
VQLAGLLGADPSARLVDEIYARSEGNPFFAEELVLAAGRRPEGAAVEPAAGAAGPGGAAGRAHPAAAGGLREASTSSCWRPSPAAPAMCSITRCWPRRSTASCSPANECGCTPRWPAPWRPAWEAGDAPATGAARLAHHWAAAGDQPAPWPPASRPPPPPRGVRLAEAQLQLERALGLWDRIPDAEQRAGMDRVGLRARCGEAAYAAADFTRAAELVRRALALVDQAHQPQRAGLLGEQLARCLRMRGDPAALDAQQQAVRLMAPEASVERARVLGSLAQYLLVVADRSEEPGDWRSRRSPSPSRSVPSPRRPPPAPPGRRPHLPRRP